MKFFNYFFFILFISFTGFSQKTPLAVPTQNQLNWHTLEYYAFIHFNMNTFTDMEWGMGNENPQWFNPTELNAEQWVKVIKNAGMKGVILTAKHHDGFCLWPSKYTEHSVKNSPWKNGKGDVVKELSQACKKHNIKFGVYLSPWDRNHAEYGKEEYVTYFHNQLKELLTNYGEIFEVWFDGANGGTGYYGGANEKRTINAKTYYQWDKVTQIVRQLQPKAVIFGENDDIRWVGNEKGISQANWCTIDMDTIPQGMTLQQYLSTGLPTAKKWVPAEADVSIRPGWYYHPREDHQVKSLEQLTEIYYNSVGKNTALLLNFPVDTRGLIHQKDIEQVMKLKATLNADFKTNLIKTAKVKASSIASKEFSANNTIKKNKKLYWSPSSTDKTPTLTYQFKNSVTFNRIVLQEFIAKGQKIASYKIQILKNGQWTDLIQGETIGYKTILRTPRTKTNAIRLQITESLDTPLLSDFQIFNAPDLVTTPILERQKNGLVSLNTTDKNLEIYYTTNHQIPTNASTRYTEPFLVTNPTKIKAVSYSSHNKKYSDILEILVDVSKENWKIHQISLGDISKAEFLIDENPSTEFYLQPNNENFVVIDLGKSISIKGFSYTPPQSRWAKGVISKYEFYISNNGTQWQQVSTGEFANIKNNPIEQKVYFSPQKTKFIKLVALSQADDSKSVGFGELGIISE